jgi:tRNA threonylcarbamoyladenosine biosynthesis protein TsaE
MHDDYIRSNSPLATEKKAQEIGERIKGREVIELVGDLGSGKTTFIRGLARGMNVKDLVQSPSFTLHNQYKAGDLTLHHFDFYRLSDPGILALELAEIIKDHQSAVVIEWPGVVKSVLSDPHVIIKLQTVGEMKRDIEIKYPKQYAYLFKRKP